MNRCDDAQNVHANIPYFLLAQTEIKVHASTIYLSLYFCVCSLLPWHKFPIHRPLELELDWERNKKIKSPHKSTAQRAPDCIAERTNTHCTVQYTYDSLATGNWLHTYLIRITKVNFRILCKWIQAPDLRYIIIINDIVITLQSTRVESTCVLGARFGTIVVDLTFYCRCVFAVRGVAVCCCSTKIQYVHYFSVSVCVLRVMCAGQCFVFRYHKLYSISARRRRCVHTTQSTHYIFIRTQELCVYFVFSLACSLCQLLNAWMAECWVIWNLKLKIECILVSNSIVQFSYRIHLWIMKKNTRI